MGNKEDNLAQYIEPRDRPPVLRSQTTRCIVPWGNGTAEAFITLSFDERNYVVEVFARAGKAGSELSAMTEAACRAGSLAMRFGIDPKHLADAWAGIQGSGAATFEGDGVKYLSVPDAIAQVIRKAIE